jgi:ATP-dependent DNA ligase
MSRHAFKSLLGFIRPEIPTLVPGPPSGEGWIHEIKYDGYRTLIVIDRGQVRAFTRMAMIGRGPIDGCDQEASVDRVRGPI